MVGVVPMVYCEATNIRGVPGPAYGKLEVAEGVTSPLVVCAISGKRYAGIRDLHTILRPLLMPGRVALVAKDGLCSYESLYRYVRWAKACFFIRIESPDEVRFSKGWRQEFGPEDFVRDDHWTETALDDFDDWDAVIYYDGDEEVLLAHAHDISDRVNDLIAHPERSKHRAPSVDQVKRTEHTTPVPDCMIPGWGIPAEEDKQGNVVIKSWIEKEKEAELRVKAADKYRREEAFRKNPELRARAEAAAAAARRWDHGAGGKGKGRKDAYDEARLMDGDDGDGDEDGGAATRRRRRGQAGAKEGGDGSGDEGGFGGGGGVSGAFDPVRGSQGGLDPGRTGQGGKGEGGNHFDPAGGEGSEREGGFNPARGQRRKGQGKGAAEETTSW